MQHGGDRRIGQCRFPLLDAAAFQDQGTARQSAGKFFNQPAFAAACFRSEKNGALRPAGDFPERGFHHIEFCRTA